jgi:hypothetical protein
MGAWGTGIFDNDLSLDVQGHYEEFLEDFSGESDNDHQEAYKKLIDRYKAELNGYCASDEADFWFAVAEVQMKDNVLFRNVRDKCMELLLNRDIFELWGEDEETFNERIDSLIDFVTRLKAA